MNIERQIQYLIEKGSEWVNAQRMLLRSSGRPLFAHESRILLPFFGKDLVEKVRIVQVPQIKNPDFYRDLEGQGVSIPLDFSSMAGITFDDTVVLSQIYAPAAEAWLPVIFHECVHVAQYELLGIGEFVRRYVTGWAHNGFDYRKIPLECDAYELEERFHKEPHVVFSVQQRIAAKLRRG